MKGIGSFVCNSAMLGAGLAADAFSVSVVNGIREPKMRGARVVLIAGTFALFQAVMPLTGWFLTNFLLNYFKAFHRLLPWVSQFFLLYLGLRMILESGAELSGEDGTVLTAKGLLVQAVATSIDALLVGLSIAEYHIFTALICVLIIAAVTFVLCFLGVRWGRVLGIKLAGKAELVGGMVRILIAARQFADWGR